MKVAILSESPLTSINGVSTSVRQVTRQLVRLGHQVQIHAPGPQVVLPDVAVHTYPVVPVPVFPVGLPTPRLRRHVEAFAPDVVHVASPFAFGFAGVQVATRLGVPTVAVFQTDVAAFAPHYRLGALVGPAWSVMRRIHRACTRTLVPSSAAAETLMAHGITNTHLWGRGVDHELFHPRARDAALHHRWGQGKTVVGYVGRLAPEKNLEALTYLATDSRYQLVLVGDGPQRAALQRRYPTAIFTGPLTGVELATAYATMDVVVHPGPNETFCQTLQEAHASGTPTVAVAAGGPIDLIKPGVNGYLVGPENLAAELPDAVAAAQHLRGARATVAGRGWDRLTRDLIGHYRASTTPALR